MNEVSLKFNDETVKNMHKLYQQLSEYRDETLVTAYMLIEMALEDRGLIDVQSTEQKGE